MNKTHDVVGYRHKCLKCKHNWKSFKEKPIYCPKCHNPKWWEERKVKKVRK